MSSLWGDEFVVEEKKKTKKVLEKINKPKKEPKVVSEKIVKSKKVSIEDKLRIIREDVERILGTYKEDTQVIYTLEDLHSYIDKAIENGVIAVDTETNNSLQPITCKLMGACIYTPGRKNAYIPINHINRITGEKLSNQLTEQDIYNEFSRLSKVNIIMHNGKFDYEVIKCTCGIELDVYWDTMIGARILNENERAGLKEQYINKIDSSIEKYSIEHLFQGIEYAVIEPELFALYAATDSFMTYKLFEYQWKEFNKPENKGIYNVFRNIEMPVLKVTAEMELNGICLDLDYAERLSNKYHKMMDDIDVKIKEELHKYDDMIAKWRLTPEANYKAPNKTKSGDGFAKSKSEQLEDPVSVTSAVQLAILIYDVLKVPAVDKKSPRGTGEPVLQKILEKRQDLNFLNLILEKRTLVKLINTYIDKLPECIVDKTGRLHAHFNQIGADTGRFSSSDPNLQNIPSHNNEIRMMFTASSGYILVGSDYSQQEPRLLAHYSQDEKMINSYKEGKDLYANMASEIYHNKYEDNKEFYSDGIMNPEGKKRRTNVKSILLGLMYGRGVASIAEQIKDHDGPVTQEDVKEAQHVQNNFFKSFPKVKKWMDKTVEDAEINGYVEDAWGRRRRLPDLSLPKIEVSFNDNNEYKLKDFNPLIGSKGKFSNFSNELIQNYIDLAEKAKSKTEMDKLKERAAKDSISIKDNGGFISQAQRQAVNARIQGGAASMSKKAMTAIYSNQELKELGYRMLIVVHDEIIGECPIENQERVKEIVSKVMIEAAKPECTVPMKCDADSFSHWYEDVYFTNLKEEYENILKNNDKEKALEILYNNHEECTREQLLKML